MKYENEIREIIAKVIHLTVPEDEIKLDTNFQGVGMDSMSFIALVCDIEDYFCFEFPMEKLIIENASTLRQLINIVEETIG